MSGRCGAIRTSILQQNKCAQRAADLGIAISATAACKRPQISSTHSKCSGFINADRKQIMVSRSRSMVFPTCGHRLTGSSRSARCRSRFACRIKHLPRKRRRRADAFRLQRKNQHIQLRHKWNDKSLVVAKPLRQLQRRFAAFRQVAREFATFYQAAATAAWPTKPPPPPPAASIPG